MSGESGAILLVHKDSELLDTLTRVFEARGLEVAIAATALSALSLLESRGGKNGFSAIVAAWDPEGKIGAKLYRRAVDRHFGLRDRFVFVGDERTEEFEELVGGLCLLLRPDELDEIARVAESAVDRIRRVNESRSALDEIEWTDLDSPTLLLVDDEPLQLSFMVELFRGLSFSVTPAESGNAAIALLQAGDYDVIVADWYMPDGSGADLYRWMSEQRPEVVDRLIFISGHAAHEIAAEAPGVRSFPKGQDSKALVHAVIEAARKATR